MIVTTVALLVSFDALALWLAREECAPVLLPPGKGLRGREGKTIKIPLALTGSGRVRLRREVRVAVMPSTPESETATRVNSDPQRLKLERPEPAAGESASASTAPIHLWPWSPEVALLRRGFWPGPRVGIERSSHLGIWRLRKWFDSPEQLRIDADLRSGRREILRSPVYRKLVASRQTPWTGHGRDFERLREYQAGDTYSEIAWKSTARRGAPVTRLFQWEQKQEVYFVVDQARTPAIGPLRNRLPATVPMGAEAGSLFRSGPIAGVRACARPKHRHRERCPTSARAATAAGSLRGNGVGGRDGGTGTGRRIWAGDLRGRAEVLVTRGKRSNAVSSISRSPAACRAFADDCGLRSALQRNSGAAASARVPAVAGEFDRALRFGLAAPRSRPGPLVARALDA